MRRRASVEDALFRRRVAYATTQVTAKDQRLPGLLDSAWIHLRETGVVRLTTVDTPGQPSYVLAQLACRTCGEPVTALSHKVRRSRFCSAACQTVFKTQNQLESAAAGAPPR